MSPPNRDVSAAWRYHEATKHSYERLRRSSHYLDWENQPIPFKIYPRLEPLPLPRDLSSPGVPALAAIGASAGGGALDLQSLSEVLYLSAGITKRKRYPGGEILFRAAACTGALYHIDLYVISGEIPGLEAGVYHFGPQDFALRRLRRGDHRGALVAATAEEPAVGRAPVIIACASTFWRNAWKYQARAYRHCYWDSGTIIANLLAAAAARRLATRVVLGFVDSEVNRLLGLDGEREAALELIALGRGAVETPPAGGSLPGLSLETAPLSRREVDYPAIREMHAASSLEGAAEVARWRAAPAGAREAASRLPPDSIRLEPLGEGEGPAETLESVIRRRGSTRAFAREPIGFREFCTILERSTRGFSSDFSPAGAPPLNDLYLIVNAVEGVPAGAYVFHREGMALEPLRRGNFRGEAGDLGLGQELPADASADLFFLTRLDRVLERFGNRGYRAAQLEAAVAGGRVYLAAYAQRLGASGLTFFDDDVTEFFSPHAAGKSVMFLVAVGKSARRRRQAG